jgi:hypothetical protein
MDQKTGISRRRVIQHLGGAAALGMSSRLESLPAPPGGGPPRVLALIGDRYHNSDYIRVGLGRLFRELNLPVNFTINYDQISARLLESYRLLVCLRDGMIWPDGYLEPNDYDYSRELENSGGWPNEVPQPWITQEQGRAIKDFVATGNAFYALHNTSNVSLYSKDFRDVMGGAYIGHPALRPFKVRVVNREHPITSGVRDFMVNDEQHFVTYDKDPKYIILRSENMDGLVYENLGAESIGGWAYEWGKGRVVFTAAGHTLHALWQPEYFKLQKNPVRWLLKMDQPAS